MNSVSLCSGSTSVSFRIKKTAHGNSLGFIVYGYYRTDPPRLQWGFFRPATGIAVVYDAEADLITTVFKPAGGSLFFQRQMAAVKIDREGW